MLYSCTVSDILGFMDGFQIRINKFGQDIIFNWIQTGRCLNMLFIINLRRKNLLSLKV